MATSVNRQALFLLSLFVLLSSASAMYLAVEGPVSSTLYDNGVINLGKVGPGESFYILASATTTNGTGAVVNIGWDTLKTLELPTGWSSQASPLYEDPMKMKVTVAPNTPTGTYMMLVRAVNLQNYSKLGNLTFRAYINVTPDVFASSVEPLNITAGVGQPVNLKIVINNTGASDDPFLINAYGLPAWDTPAKVISEHSKVGTYWYPIFVNEPGVYSFNLTINSTSSPLIRQTYNVKLVADASVLNDYKATGEGVVLSPIIYEPAYAFMLFLNDLYHFIFR